MSRYSYSWGHLSTFLHFVGRLFEKKGAATRETLVKTLTEGAEELIELISRFSRKRDRDTNVFRRDKSTTNTISYKNLEGYWVTKTIRREAILAERQDTLGHGLL